MIKKIIYIYVFTSSLYSQCLGDLTYDNLIDTTDFIALLDLIMMDTQDIDGLSDINYDNQTDIFDILTLSDIMVDESACEIIWGQETDAVPEYYFAGDIGANQIDQIIDYYTIASDAWGNYGPLEFWVVGTDVNSADTLDEYYCALRLQKDPCLNQNYLQWCLNREYSFVDYANNGGAGLSLSREDTTNCHHYSYMEITLASMYPFPNESDYDVVTMHEYFHVYQQAHIETFNYSERAQLMVVNPWWSEGGAEYMAQLLYSQQDGVNTNYLDQRMSWKMQSKADLINGEWISEIPYGQRAYIAYDLGAWAIAYLISISSLESYRIDFYERLNEYGWEESFALSFGMTSDQFLTDFHQFLNLDLNEQLSILP